MIICSCEDLWKLGKILSVSKMIHCSSFITFLAGNSLTLACKPSIAQQPTETSCHRPDEKKNKKNRSRLKCKPNLAAQAPTENQWKSLDLRPIFTSPSRQVAKSIRKQVSFGGCSKHWDRFVTGIWSLSREAHEWHRAVGLFFGAVFCWVSLQHLDALGCTC